MNNLLISSQGLPQNVTEYAKMVMFQTYPVGRLRWSNAIDEYSIPLRSIVVAKRKGRKCDLPLTPCTTRSLFQGRFKFLAFSENLFGKGIATAVEINLISKLINGRGRTFQLRLNLKSYTSFMLNLLALDSPLGFRSSSFLAKRFLGLELFCLEDRLIRFYFIAISF